MVQALSKTTKKTLPRNPLNKHNENPHQKTTSKISGASTIKNNLKNIAQKPLKKTH
jgi:hypothetical protein